MGLYRVTFEMMPDNPAKGRAGVKTGLWRVVVYRRKGAYVEDEDFIDVHDEDLPYEEAREASRALEHELNEEGGDWVLSRQSKPADVDLERTIRSILKNDYGFGDRNIESKDIYDKLIAASVTVPELAMADVFDKLKSEGIIRGRGRLNRDAVRQHGAYSILWVSRYV
jgi:hypothetical protein